VQSQGFYDANASIIAAYLSYSPSFAQGSGLSSLVKLNGLRRQTPSNSTAEVTLIGQAYTVITNGVVADRFDNLWNLPPEVVIPPSGEVTVTAQAQSLGSIPAAPGSINRIFTLQPGWQSVVNRAPATEGFPVESDATLRKRQAISTSLPAITPLLSIWGAVANVPGVGRTHVLQNDTWFYDNHGIPPHSIAVIVAGGDDYEIARVIAWKKNVGAGTFGSTEVIVYDPPAAPITINFFRLQETQIYVRIWIRPLEGEAYNTGTGQLIVLAVAAYINSLAIGQHVYAAWVCSPASLTGDAAIIATGRTQAELDILKRTYVLDQILLGTDPNYIDQHEIDVPFHSAAAIAISNIFINIEEGPVQPGARWGEAMWDQANWG
jgi:uncharacterized phage protein gp47/JayE